MCVCMCVCMCVRVCVHMCVHVCDKFDTHTHTLPSTLSYFRGSEERETELWIVTDYYALGSLHDLLKKQTLSLKQFCDLAESAAVGTYWSCAYCI